VRDGPAVFFKGMDYGVVVAVERGHGVLILPLHVTGVKQKRNGFALP